MPDMPKEFGLLFKWLAPPLVVIFVLVLTFVVIVVIVGGY
jgi:hypothetical protein